MDILNPSQGFAYDAGGAAGTGGGGGAAISAGTQSVSSGTVIFSNSNGITFGMAGSQTITAIYTVPSTAGLGTGNFGAIAINAATTYTSGTVVFSNSNGVTFGTNAQTVTASVQTNYLTSQSNQAASASNGSFTFQTVGFSNANNVTFGTSAGSIVTASVAAQSVQPVAASASNGSFLFSTVAFSNANNVTFGTSAGSIVTASVAATVAQTNQQMTAFATSNTTQSSTGTFNASSIIFAGAGIASVGITNGSVLISVPAGGGAGDGGVFAGVSTMGNTAGSTGTVSTGNFVLVGSNGITLSQSTGAAGSAATITINGPGPLSTFDPYELRGASTGSAGLPTATSDVVRVYPMLLEEAVNAGAMNMHASMAFLTVGTSSGQQTAGFRIGLYTRGTGTNSTTIGSLLTRSIEWNITGNNSSYTINQITQTLFTGFGATAATNSAGVNISSGYTGMKLFAFPINSLLTPGPYWLAIMATNSTSSVNVGISLSTDGFVVNTRATAFAPMGSFSSSYSRDGDPLGGAYAVGFGSWSSAGSVTGLPASMALTSISHGLTQIPYIKFWST